MITLTGYWRFCVICILIISVCTGSDEPVLQMEIKAFDSSGRDASLLYDGGSANIRCSCTDYSPKDFGLSVDNGTRGSNFTELVTGNDTRIVTGNISINPGTLFKRYMCHARGHNPLIIQILYVLCNPMSVKPKEVCPKPGDFCHMTAAGLTECKPMAVNACFYGFTPNDIGRKRHPAVKLLPKFKVACPEVINDTGEYQSTIKDYSLKGLCYFFAYEGIRPYSQTPTFLSIRPDECQRECSVYIYQATDCEGTREKIAMVSWNFRDLASNFSVCINVSTTKWTSFPVRKLICSVSDGVKNVVESPSWTSEYQHGWEEIKTLGSTKDFSQFSTPALVDIVCIDGGATTFLQYQTNLLLFRSDKDLKWVITEEELAVGDDKVIYQFNVNVTAGDGLYVCAKEWKENERCPCTPAAASNILNLTTMVAFTLGEDNFTIAFYIGLFASSPKEKYVLIHYTIANHTVNQSETSNIVPMIKSRNASVMTGVDMWMVGVTAGLVVAIVATAIAVIAMTVMLVLSIRQGSHSGRPSTPVQVKDSEVPSLYPKYINKTLLDHTSTRSRSLKLSDEQK